MDVINTTQGLCAECHKVVSARICRTEDKVVMKKDCPTHGLSEVVISNDPAWYERVTSFETRLEKPGSASKQLPMNNAWFYRLSRLPARVI
jgi:uncharacterized radical SAM superfamily Fe-S cluster-containing enzyme